MSDIDRSKNDKYYGTEWAKDCVKDMPIDKMIGYIYTPNSTFLQEEMKAKLRVELKDILDILIETRKIVCRGAATGFNIFDKTEGDWSTDLYTNNGKLSEAIKKLEHRS